MSVSAAERIDLNYSQPGVNRDRSAPSRVLGVMVDRDVDGVMLRLLCEKAEQRLEQAWAASEVAHRTVQLPDGSYHWAREDEADPPR